MKTFKQSSNAIILHALLQGMRNTVEIPSTEWFDTTDEDKQKVFGMVMMLEKSGYDTHAVYTRWWQMFPFGTPEFNNLNLLQKDLVNLTFNMVAELTAGYGEQLRDD